MKVEVKFTPTKTQRRAPAQVLGIKDTGASPWGSTYQSRKMSCPRKHQLANQLRIFPKQRSDALDLGLIFHEALDRLYRALYSHQRGGEPRQLSGCLREAFAVVDAFRDEPGYERIHPTVERMLSAYAERYLREDADHLRILHVEVPVQQRVPNLLRGGKPMYYSARFDGVAVMEIDGEPRTVVLEHKTAYALNDSVVFGYHQDLQVMGQAWLATRTLDWSKYPPFGGVLVNIVSKTKTVRMQRTLVSPTDEQLLGWEQTLRDWLQIEDTFARLGYPPNLTSCKQWSGCQYKALCGKSLHLRGDKFAQWATEHLPEEYYQAVNDGVRR